MKKIVIIGFILFFKFSCNIGKEMDDSLDLGNKYRLIQDIPKCIIFQESHQAHGSGRNVVPPSVRDYQFNERYIIAKSIDYLGKDNRLKYWIVDKKKEGAHVEPLDSISFYKQLKGLNIDLKFE
jgi:hypothetical protein